MGCGRPKDECFDSEGPNYEASVLVCRACEVRGIRSDEWAEHRKPHGAYTVITEG